MILPAESERGSKDLECLVETGERSPRLPGQRGILVPEADISHITRKWLDVPYASISPAQQLDIYLPESGDGPFPVIVFIHGGAFQWGDKREFCLEAYMHGLERGYAVVSLNYRLSGEAFFPAGLQDVKAALRWLRAHAALYLLDGSRIAACGGSAGANYAAMVGVADGVALFDDPALGNPGFPADVRVVVDWFAPTDFLKMDEQLAANGLGPCNHSQPDSPESIYLGARIADVPEKVRLANPMTHVSDRMPPILIRHGTADAEVPVQQSIDFARVIEEQVGPGRCELDVLQNAGHGDPMFHSDENIARVFAFIDRHLG